MFGVQAGDHAECVQEFLRSEEIELTSSMVLAAATSKLAGVTATVLDSFGRQIHSKTSDGVCDFEFHSLHLLDDVR